MGFNNTIVNDNENGLPTIATGIGDHRVIEDGNPALVKMQIQNRKLYFKSVLEWLMEKKLFEISYYILSK